MKKYLILLLILLAFSPIYAHERPYWELTPVSLLENGEYLYQGTVLIAREVAPYHEMLIRIQDSQDEKRSTQTWVKYPTEHPLLSMGEKILVTLNPLSPKKILLDSQDRQRSFFVEASWNGDESRRIPFPPLATLVLNDVEYDIHNGQITKTEYKTWITENSSDHELLHHELQLEIGFMEEGIAPYSDLRYDIGHYRNSRGAYLGGQDFKDGILRMLRDWKSSDQIKILVNHYYPGFWWIVNESRNEALFVAQGKAQSVTDHLFDSIPS